MELGAGTGLVGLVAAAMGAHTVLTDLATVIPRLESRAHSFDLTRVASRLRQNAVANASVICEGGCPIVTDALSVLKAISAHGYASASPRCIA